MRKKLKYEEAEVEIIIFENFDIITTSGGGNSENNDNWRENIDDNGWI